MKQFDLLTEQYILEALIKITGPAILYKPEKIIVKGIVGTSHMMLWGKLRNLLSKKLNLNPGKAEDLIAKSSEKDLIMGFMTSEDKFVTREQAWQIAQKYKNLQSTSNKPKLASEYL